MLSGNLYYPLTSSAHGFTVRTNQIPTGRPVTVTSRPLQQSQGRLSLQGGPMLSTRKVLVAFLTPFLIALPLAAQIDKATVDAVAVDQSKAPLPGVTVTLTRPATGLQMVAVTDSAGIARFNSLSPGSYSVQFSLEGFAAVK